MLVGHYLNLKRIRFNSIRLMRNLYRNKEFEQDDTNEKVLPPRTWHRFGYRIDLLECEQSLSSFQTTVISILRFVRSYTCESRLF